MRSMEGRPKRPPASRRSPESLLGVRVSVVLAQQIPAEVAVEVAPNRMHVIGLRLGVVTLDQEGGPLQPVIKRFVDPQTPPPGEANRVEAPLPPLPQPLLRQGPRQPRGVFGQELAQNL